MRVPLERKIDLDFANFEGMVTGVSANLSTSGMFIRSDNPEAAGTEFDFALRIEEWSPVQGTAKVVWIRSRSESPERPAGMGVQFVDLDAQSRRMIRWLVDKHLQEGGKPFDLDRVPAGASKYGRRPTGVGGTGKSSRRKSGKGPRAARGRSRGLRLALGGLALAILAAGAYGAYRMWLAGQPAVGQLQGPRAMATPAGEQMEDTEAELTDEPAVAAELVLPSGSADAVATFIQSWARAWEARDTAAVFAHYADDFDATTYGGRQRWESEIQRQIDSSEHIRVAVSALEISFPTADTARALFFRSSRSNVTNESGRLALDLEFSAGSWKIRSEQALE